MRIYINDVSVQIVFERGIPVQNIVSCVLFPFHSFPFGKNVISVKSKISIHQQNHKNLIDVHVKTGIRLVINNKNVTSLSNS